MPWYYAVAEARHELQNPTSAEKILLLGEALELDASSRVLDIACGSGGPAILLAREFGCSIVGVERATEFVERGRRRIAEAGLTDRIEIVQADGASFPLRPEWDAALCLGATFVWGTMADAAPALAPVAAQVAIGEPYWRRLPLPEGADDEGYVDFGATVERFERPGVTLTTVIDSSIDDFDRYESLHWRSLEHWLAANPDDPDSGAIREQHERARRDYVAYRRELLGWAIFVGR